MRGPARPRSGAAVAAVAAVAACVAGCGGGSAPGRPRASEVPLVPGTRVVADVRACDGGAHPFCARELVLMAPVRPRDPGALKVAERRVLGRAGWRDAVSATLGQFAADSPGDRLRVSYATAEQELLAIDEHRIQRAPRIVHALSTTLLQRRAALSLVLQAGSG